MRPISPPSELGNRLQVVGHSAPGLFGSLWHIAYLELLFGMSKEALGGLDVILDFGLSHRRCGAYPTVPSRLTRSSWLASAANSKGSSLKMPLQKPLMTM